MFDHQTLLIGLVHKVSQFCHAGDSPSTTFENAGCAKQHQAAGRVMITHGESFMAHNEALPSRLEAPGTSNVASSTQIVGACLNQWQRQHCWGSAPAATGNVITAVTGSQ